jgi:chromosome segregation protein
LSALVEKRSRIEVQLSQVEMRVNAIEEHIRKRYQLELGEFSMDLYLLKVAYRDALKRPRGGGGGSVSAGTGSSAGMGAGGAAPEAEGAPPSTQSPEADSDGATVAAEASLGDPDFDARQNEDAEPALELDWARIDSMVREIDQRLDAMGPVNMDAIQEYEELEERHGFLQKQHADLINSKQELLEVIAKINATTRQLFAETFEKVRINFQEMFTELFGGGRANLVLTDESDPLESGIEIIAKPPGKQLQSISLLSGGEKTMTAVSLLFSIYMVKPSPFCVLDEMDAPLDESNINRFIRILDRFVGQSQFVVISHNKRTIARADALYGVTMEEHGVSRLVGVKFTRRDESRAGTDVIGAANTEQVPSVAETFGKSPKLHSEEKSEEMA